MHKYSVVQVIKILLAAVSHTHGLRQKHLNTFCTNCMLGKLCKMFVQYKIQKKTKKMFVQNKIQKKSMVVPELFPRFPLMR